jgi:hypothetical protein
MVMGDKGIGNYKRSRQNDNIDRHAAGAIRRDAYHLMEPIRGFMQNH